MADWEAPGTLDPKPPTTLARLRADTLVFARLWISDPTGRLVPDLAAAVPRPHDGTLTVRLRTGLRWSDGSPITAADVVRSCATQCGAIAATALSATQVRFATDDPQRLAAVFVVPRDLSGAIASGPFRLSSATPTQLVYARNPYYHGRPPYLAGIAQLVSASHDAMVEAAQAGEADFLPHLGPADIAAHLGDLRHIVTVSEREEFVVARGLDPRTVAALSAAIDRQRIVAESFGGAGRALGPPQQLTLARFLTGGHGLSLPLRTVCDDPVRAAEAARLTMDWAAIGVTVTSTCAPIDQLVAPEAPPGLALYSDLAAAVPAHAIALLRWPAVRAVSPALHGFVANDTSGTDLWNVADWWLS